jgi:hypothetical protein
MINSRLPLGASVLHSSACIKTEGWRSRPTGSRSTVVSGNGDVADSSANVADAPVHLRSRSGGYADEFQLPTDLTTFPSSKGVRGVFTQNVVVERWLGYSIQYL